jgi:ATP-dependent protease ClpP protease subunit
MLVDRNSGEIFVYDVIGGDMFGEGITTEAVMVALDSLGGKRARIRINSPGGNADTGIAIYNALRRYKWGVDTVVDSLAASAASIIALAGENRYTATGGRWMIHRAMGLAFGNVDDIAGYITMLNKYDDSIVEIYSEHIGKTESEIRSMLAAETWFTTDEAIAVGLSTAKETTDAIKPNVANWFKNAPANIYKEAIEGVKVPAVHRTAAFIRSRL